jgi:Fur family transcriptional regulator, ferric uptake regulator
MLTNHSEELTATASVCARVAKGFSQLEDNSGRMTSEKASAQRQELRARIQEAGLRCTAARLAVLRELLQATSPLSHADLASTLARQRFDRATVYRNLVEMCNAGILSRIDLGDHIWRFELRTNLEGPAVEHPHFLCTECGEVSCLVGVEISIRPGPHRKRSTLGTVTEILLKGRCTRCS